jgi:hypothetical protein
VKTEEHIKAKIEMLKESLKNAENQKERMYFNSKIATLEWVLED